MTGRSLDFDDDFNDFEPDRELEAPLRREPNGGKHHDHEVDADDQQRPGHLIKSSAEFVAHFVPPEYLLDGILQRRFCYAFTAKTGTGKTAILLMIAAHVPLGRAVGGRDVERGRVLFFSGENPDDVRMRLIAMAQQYDFDIDTIDVHFIPDRFHISERMGAINAEIEATGDVVLVIIDTSTAYFEGDDENNNAQAIEHARRLRGLTTLPGGPCVLVACHPTKNASDDNLIPRGGGAFLNEIDGNLTAKRNDSAVEVHWQGKFRGPDFAPMSFQLRTVTHERLKDSKGRLIPTVVAAHLSEVAQEEMATITRSREDALLKVLVDHPGTSQAELAKLLGWQMRDGSPYKVQVSRTLTTLVKAKLVAKERGTHVLTPKGLKAVGKDSKTEPKPHAA
ncbi:MAG: AAA family ATPase [Steroidobacteraceae bacterium]